MKKVGWFLVAVTVITGLMILYIYQNIRLIQASYSLRQREAKLVEVSDEYKTLSCDLNALLSPAQLEQRMAQSGIELIQPTDIKLVERVITVQPSLFAKNVHSEHRFGVLGSLELIPEAHADATE